MFAAAADLASAVANVHYFAATALLLQLQKREASLHQNQPYSHKNEHYSDSLHQ